MILAQAKQVSYEDMSASNSLSITRQLYPYCKCLAIIGNTENWYDDRAYVGMKQQQTLQGGPRAFIATPLDDPESTPPISNSNLV